MAMSVKQMLEAADAAVPRINPAQAQEMIAKGNALVVDVRDPPEVATTGRIPGATSFAPIRRHPTTTRTRPRQDTHRLLRFRRPWPARC
jgi:hypothetical protein